MPFPVCIPDTVSIPAHAALAALIRFDRMLGRSAPLAQLDAALAEGARAKAELNKAMRAARHLRALARREQAQERRELARYQREEQRISRAAASEAGVRVMERAAA